MRIAIDTAGGDFAPRNIVDGAVVAARHLGFGLILVGDRASIEAELARQPDASRSDISLLETPDVVGMAEAPVAAFRRKPRASVRVAAETVARGEASAFFSAGNTGATLLADRPRSGCSPVWIGRPWRRRSRPWAAVRCCWTWEPTSNAGRSICCSSVRWVWCKRGCRSGSPNRRWGCCRSERKPARGTS